MYQHSSDEGSQLSLRNQKNYLPIIPSSPLALYKVLYVFIASNKHNWAHHLFAHGSVDLMLGVYEDFLPPQDWSREHVGVQIYIYFYETEKIPSKLNQHLY